MSKIVTGAFGAVGSLLGLKPKIPKMPAMPRPVTRDEAADRIRADDRVLARRGRAADIITGQGGAEAATSAKDLLGE